VNFSLNIFAAARYSLLDGTFTKTAVSESDRSASDALELFQAALPGEFFERQRVAAGLPPEKGIYTAAVVVMLVILQRLLQGKATLSGAVQQIVNGRLKALVPGRKRVREGTLSGNTGAYSRARSRLPRAVVDMSADQVVEYLLAEHKEALPGLGRQAFLVDGSSVALPNTRELLKVCPAARGGKGESHWPVMRVLVAHDLVSGIALRPAFGPMYGDHAVSGQALAKEVIDRLPAGSVAVPDRNFGVFSVTWHAHQKHHPVVVRMTDARARSLSGGKLPSQADQWMDWKPGAWDRRTHPHLPADAVIRVRFISAQVVRKGKVTQLYLVTTLNLPIEQMLELYGFRWNIELDLRSLKQTADLQTLRSATPDMAAKELVPGVTSCNFVRAAIYAAARAANLNPRQISFSRAQDVVNACMPNLQMARSEQEYARERDKMLRRIAQCKLPQSSHRPGYPRAIWPRGSSFPRKKNPGTGGAHA
jgi:putative transposase